MSSIGSRCHELRINDENKTWRIIYRIDEDAIVVVDVFVKKTNTTPDSIIGIAEFEYEIRIGLLLKRFFASLRLCAR